MVIYFGIVLVNTVRRLVSYLCSKKEKVTTSIQPFSPKGKKVASRPQYSVVINEFDDEDEI